MNNCDNCEHPFDQITFKDDHIATCEKCKYIFYFDDESTINLIRSMDVHYLNIIDDLKARISNLEYAIAR